MLQIAIVEKETTAKELVFQIGQVLHEYAWSFTHFTSLVDFVKQQETSFDVVFLHEQFQTKRIYDSLIKDKNYAVIFISDQQLLKCVYPQAYRLSLKEEVAMKRQLQNLLLPIVKRLEEYCFTYRELHVMMKIKDIYYIEKQGKYLLYHTKLGEFKQRANMSDIVTYFQPFHFLHIHVSYLVNDAYIFGLHKEELILKDKTTLPISRHKYPEVKKFFDHKQQA